MDTTLLWADRAHEDVDAALVTLGTGQTALVVVTGSSQMPNNSARQQDRIYFHSDKPSVSLDEEGTNASCVAVLDLNGDGNDGYFHWGALHMERLRCRTFRTRCIMEPMTVGLKRDSRRGLLN